NRDGRRLSVPWCAGDHALRGLAGKRAIAPPTAGQPHDLPESFGEVPRSRSTRPRGDCFFPPPTTSLNSNCCGAGKGGIADRLGVGPDQKGEPKNFRTSWRPGHG